ncbi:MAG: ABC transporter permease [Candidatus Tectomicrobia bacterium]|nr:ABC transporter permease [Candidatus Tectomicrobia bacterium]
MQQPRGVGWRFVGSLGAGLLRLCGSCGSIAHLWLQTLRQSVEPPYRLRLIVKQMELVGVNSLPVVLVTTTFTGMVLALQSYIAFRRFNAETLVASVVALSITRELGPVITGLMVAGRAGSAMAAEIGTMKVTEQIDALISLATNPVKYLVVPRFLASAVVLPLLTIIADLVGIVGGYIVAVYIFNSNPNVYVRNTTYMLETADVYTGLAKSVVFGMMVSIVGCAEGFHAEEGASGVGRAATRAVVFASLGILISDYFLTALFY